MTNQIPSGAVVCGVDGSPDSDAALTTAAELAQLEHRHLHIVHAERIPVAITYSHVHHELGNLPAMVRESARAVLRDAETAVRQSFPGLDVTTTLQDADPREALQAAAEQASVIVLGSRGRGGIRAMLLGSVSLWVSQHAPCPTLVVRPQTTPDPDAPVVVGTDTTEVSANALDFAFAYASLHQRRLVVVHCFEEPYRGGYGLTGVPDDDLEGLPEERLAISESVAGLREKYVDVRVDFELGRGSPAAYLTHAADRAALLVVGARQRSTVASVLTGSVSRTVVEHARCPVAVVPAHS